METVVARSIDAFTAPEWNRLFAAELEDWSYYKAVEDAALPGFELAYLGLRHEGELCAVAPAFASDYRIDTTLEGPLRHATDVVARLLPRLLTVRLLALGSPVSECCHVGFAPGASPAERRRWLDALLAAAESLAAEKRVGMFAVKDAAETAASPWDEACARLRLRRLPGLPTASLELPYANVEQYLSTLSKATRRDVRRKLAAAKNVRIEWRREIDDALPEVIRLYRATLARSAQRFEELTPKYFQSVLARMGERASCVLYRVHGELLAFNLVLHDRTRMIDKYFGMDARSAREHNLYFLSWIENVRYCIEHGLTKYQSGASVYHDKIRLGSRLSANGLWYRHRNRAIDLALASIERVFGLDREDPVPTASARRHPA